MAVEGEVASQVVSMTLDGVKMTAEIAGKGVEKVGAATMAIISLIHKKQKEHKALSVGEKKLDLMRKSGNVLQDFVIPESALSEFKKSADAFRLTYSLIKSKGTGEVIVVGYQSEASRLSRIIEGLQVINLQPETSAPDETPAPVDIDAVSNDEPFTDEQVDELFEVLNPSEEPDDINHEDAPFVTKEDKSSPSEVGSKNFESEKTDFSNHSEKTQQQVRTTNPEDRPSVRGRINNIVEKQKQQAEKTKDVAKDVTDKIKQVADRSAK